MKLIRYIVFYILSPWKYRTFKIFLFIDAIGKANKNVSFDIYNRRLKK